MRSHLDSAGIANPHFVGVRALLFLFFGLSFGALDSSIDCLRILGSPGRFWGFGAKGGKLASDPNGLARESLNLRSMDYGGYVAISVDR